MNINFLIEFLDGNYHCTQPGTYVCTLYVIEFTSVLFLQSPFCTLCFVFVVCVCLDESAACNLDSVCVLCQQGVSGM